jgi:hypothetical protein
MLFSVPSNPFPGSILHVSIKTYVMMMEELCTRIAPHWRSAGSEGLWRGVFPSPADVEAMLDSAFYDPAKLVEAGWITGLKYEDEMKLMLLQRTNSPNNKNLNSRISMVRSARVGLCCSPPRVRVVGLKTCWGNELPTTRACNNILWGAAGELPQVPWYCGAGGGRAERRARRGGAAGGWGHQPRQRRHPSRRRREERGLRAPGAGRAAQQGGQGGGAARGQVTPYLSSEITPNLSVKNEDFVRLVRAVRLNKAVKAVVLRVDR